MRTRQEIEAGVVAEQPISQTQTRPDVNYREDLTNIAPVWGLLLQMVASILLSCMTALVTVCLLWIMFIPFSIEIKRTAEIILFWIYPAFAAILMWKYFDVRTHVDIGEGAYATISLVGGWQLPRIRFNGEVSAFPRINVWKHNLGGNTADVECASAFVRVDRKDPNKGVVQVFSEGDKPPKLFFSYIPLNPFKMVRRVAQDGPEVGFENLNDIAEAVLKEALQHPKVDLQLLMNSHKFAQTLREAFQNLTDDEGKPRCFKIKVGGRYEYVIDTGYGLGIYNVQAKDLGPSKAIRDEMSERQRKLIEAQGRTESFCKAVEKIREAQIQDAELSEDMMAMIILEQLSGDEIKFWKGNMSFGRSGGGLSKEVGELITVLKNAGFDPQTIERIVRSFADAVKGTADAVGDVAMAGMGRQGGGGGRRPRRGDRRPSDDEKKGGEKK